MRPLDRNLDRSWSHRHTMIKLSWSNRIHGSMDLNGSRGQCESSRLSLKPKWNSGHAAVGYDSSWCHRHTMIKISWSQAMTPWTWVAAEGKVKSFGPSLQPTETQDKRPLGRDQLPQPTRDWTSVIPRSKSSKHHSLNRVITGTSKLIKTLTQYSCLI